MISVSVGVSVGVSVSVSVGVSMYQLRNSLHPPQCLTMMNDALT